MPRRLIAILAVLLLLVGGEALGWRWAVSALERGLATQVAQWRAQGWTVRMGKPRADGWPLHARLVVPDVALTRPLGPPGGIAWRAQHIALDVALLHPDAVVVEAQGQQHLQLGHGPGIPFVARSATVRVPLTRDVPPHSVTIALTELRADPPFAGLSVARATLTVDERPAADPGQSVLSATLDAADIGLPPVQGGRTWALGERIEALSLDFDVNATRPSGRPQGDNLAAQAAAWRDGGGAIAVRRLALRWGPLHLDGTATMTLDSDLQPMGTAEVRLAGQSETLDAMVAAQLVSPPAAQAAKAVLSLLARTPSGGGPPVVEVPLAVQNGLLTMGRIPLLRMPRLLWPDLIWSPAP